MTADVETFITDSVIVEFERAGVVKLKKAFQPWIEAASLTLHGAPANSSSTRRRVISVRWVGDNARFVKRRGNTSPHFPDLGYADGAPFEGKEFPILHPA